MSAHADTLPLGVRWDAQAELERFLDGPCDALAILLATADGRLVGQAGRIAFDHARVAAISGSMLALAEACARELGQPRCRHAIVDSGQGLAVVLRVPGEGDGWVLTTVGSATTSMGLLFSHSRHLAERLAAIAAAPAPAPLDQPEDPTA